MAETASTLRSVPEPVSDIDVYAARWRRALKADGKTEHTIRDYLRVLGLRWDEPSKSLEPIDWPGSFPAFLAANGLPMLVEEIRREHIEAYRDHYLEGTKHDGSPYSKNAARVYTAALKSFFRWLADDAEVLESNPSEKVKLPVPKKKVIEAPDFAAVDAVLATTKKTTKHPGHKAGGFCSGCFTNARDRAIIGGLMSSGAREKGMADIRLDDLNLDAGYAKIVLKGGDEHKALLDDETIKDIDNYIAIRRRHPHAPSPYLWLGPRGRMTASGLYQMIKSRAKSVGVRLSVHDFRRFSATAAARRGATTEELMDMYGWSDRTMPARYTAGERDVRAAAVHARVNPRAREV